MEEKKRLCLVIPSLHPGGMERVMSQLAQYFSAIDSLETHMILYGRKPELFYNIPDKIILHLPKNGFNNRIRLLLTISRLFFLRNKIIELRPDIILSFGERWNSFVLISVLGLSIPVFISDRCSPIKNLGYLHEILRRILYKKAAGIVVQTQKAMDIYQLRFKNVKVAVIGNPIREIPQLESMTKESIILTVGRIIPSKNHAKLIDSFLKLNMPDWKLYIVGGNALRMNLLEELRAKVNSLGASDRIKLTGSVRDVDQYYRMSKIFVFTSESEGFPNVIGEAMAASLPVVSFDCMAGPSDMINDGVNGFLIEMNNYLRLEDRLRLLMCNPGLINEIGIEARRSINRFSVEKMGGSYLKFITNKS